MPNAKIALLSFGAATALKIAVFLMASSLNRVHPFVGDNAEYHYLPIAQRLIDQHRFNGPDTRPDSKVPIGYPAALVITKVIFGSKWLYGMVCCQMGAGFVTAMLLYIMAAELGSPGAGLLSGTLWLFFPPELVISTWITAESLFTVAFVASTALVLRGLRRSSSRLAFAAGVMLGVATLFRGTCVLLPVALAPVWLRRGIRHGGTFALCYVLGTLIVVAPWTVRNWLVLDDPILVSVGFGSAFRQGSDLRFMTIAGKTRWYPVQERDAAANGIVKPSSTKESELDHYLMRLGIYSYRLRASTAAWSFVEFGGYKFARLWYGTETGGRTTQLLLGTCSLIIVPLAVWQILQLRRSQALLSDALTLTIGYFVILHWIALPEYRYMHPVFPLLILLAANSMLRLGQVLRRQFFNPEIDARSTTVGAGEAMRRRAASSPAVAAGGGTLSRRRVDG